MSSRRTPLYGGTFTQFDVTLRRLGIDVTFVDLGKPDDVAAAIRPETKALYAETIGNPGCSVLDIEHFAELAHAHDIPLVVDNTFATPYLCRPVEWGADIVTHSATKFIGGHGVVLGGVLVESGCFPFDNGKFPVLTEPSPAYHDLNFWENFREYGYLMRARTEVMRDLGAALSPFHSFLLLLGLETLSLRMQRHVENTRTSWRASSPIIRRLRGSGIRSSMTIHGHRSRRSTSLRDRALCSPSAWKVAMTLACASFRT